MSKAVGALLKTLEVITKRAGESGYTPIRREETTRHGMDKHKVPV